VCGGAPVVRAPQQPASRQGAQHAATLDDYAAMMRAALALLEATGRSDYLDHAISWAGVLDRHYRDSVGGAYFLTPDDAEALVARTKSAGDNATPSGNGVLVSVLTKLHWLTGNVIYRDRAEEIVRTFSGEIDQNFFPYSNLIDGAVLLQHGVQIVVVGDRAMPEVQALIAAARTAPLADRLLTIQAPDVVLPPDHPAAGKGLVGDQPAAYLCRGPVCSLPITDPAGLLEALRHG